MKFNHLEHIELWDFLAKNPLSHKSKWPGWKKYLKYGTTSVGTYTTEIKSLCFACHYYQTEVIKKRIWVYDDRECGEECPLEWGNNHSCYEGSALYGLYLDYFYKLAFILRNTGILKVGLALKVSRLARQIRDLPVKKGVETI